MVCMYLAQGVALLGGVALLEWVWPCWSGCGLVGVGVALLEWAQPCWSGCITVGVGFKPLPLASWKPSSPSSLPSGEDVELSAPPTPCLPGRCHVPALMIMD